MHNTHSQTRGVWKADIASSVWVDQLSDEREGRVLAGDYFLLPRKPGKGGKKRRDQCPPLAFGPYCNPYAVNFMWTSATALGLLEADSVR